MSVRVIISGGGTGGHIFPAIAIANALRRLAPDTQILFVGANGRMEMDKVPAAGYEIIGLDIQGIDRSSLWKNLALPLKLWKSLSKARQIVRSFKPDVAVGVGGYASAPLLHAAGKTGVPTLIQEQNSYAGITNKRLGAKAAKICVAFDGMERFFPPDRLLLTGNPIRRESVDIAGKRAEAARYFGLSAERKTVLVTGGSLGARTLNECMREGWGKFGADGVQLLWQCGSFYHENLAESLDGKLGENIRLHAFLQRMDLAYALADVIVARAGAGTIAELCVLGKPVILVPSPNVAEDHQTKNAQALVGKDAAILIADHEARAVLVDTALALVADAPRQNELAANIAKLAITDADEVIAREVLKLAGRGGG